MVTGSVDNGDEIIRMSINATSISGYEHNVTTKSDGVDWSTAELPLEA